MIHLRFLVELADAPPGEYVDHYFGLKEGLEQLLHRPVMLLTPAALRNPYRRAEMEAQRQAVYIAGADETVQVRVGGKARA